ncbi:hypothetical protein ABIG06_001694 [Bradyrhizobium sp. USDA 326]|uniref:hypothetical protein n=1 Tax=Bradyrhizobium sp. USDA 326 TaxID=3377726 RepID=UPI003C71B74A
MLDARIQFAATTLLFDSPLLRFAPKPLFRFRCYKRREAYSDVTRHMLKPLHLGVAETAAQCRAAEHIDLFEFK